MCTSLFLYDLHPTLLLLLTFNRDEFWDRPTHPAHFWPDNPHILAGRDALRNGTWLGMTKQGRFAFLTNYREPICANEPGKFLKTTAAPSRGALTTDFLSGTMTPLEYLQGLDAEGYCGFNLLVGDLQLQQVAYVSNRGNEGPKVLAPGAYGVSNGLLQQWPKVHKGLAALKHCMSVPSISEAAAVAQPLVHSQSAATLSDADNSRPSSEESSSRCKHSPAHRQQQQQQCREVDCELAAEGDNADGCRDGNLSCSEGLPWQILFEEVMGDRQTVPVDQGLPLTGVGEALDEKLSAIFVEPFEMQAGSRYGTRSQTVIAVWRDGRVEQRERYVERTVAPPEENWVWKETKHSFNITPSVATAAGPAQGVASQSIQRQPDKLC